VDAEPIPDFAADGLPYGSVDLNVHYGPDICERSQRASEAIRLAEMSGLRAVCLRAHGGSSVDVANALDDRAARIRVVGAITLNHPVGGINPAAVELALHTGARIVALPTSDSVTEPTRIPGGRAPVRLMDEAGCVMAAVKEVLTLVSGSNACLDLGNAAPHQVLLLVRAARAQGIERIVLSHPFFATQRYETSLQVEAARAGVTIEHCYMQFDPKYPPVATTAQLVAAIRAVGTHRVVLSGDSGKSGFSRVDGALSAFARMLRPHFTDEEFLRMFATTPTALLDLPTGPLARDIPT
jgi:hypothetical protein